MLLNDRICFDELSLYWLSISSGVRINQNGFHFLDSPPVAMQVTSWPCYRIINGLCKYENYTFLPCTSTPLTRVTDAPPPFDSFWKSELGCSKKPSLYDFHITPCDLRYGTSIIWADGQVAVQRNMDLDTWSNIFVLLIMCWLIINLGETIALVLEVQGSSPQNHTTVFLCLALMSIIIGNTPDGFWITYGDVVLYWYTISYISVYALYHVKNRNTINIIVGCMMLVSSRYYQTNETPYVPAYLLIMTSRLFQTIHYAIWGKIDVPGKAWIYIRLMLMAADVTLSALLFVFAYIPSFQDPVQAYLRLLGILFTSFCLGRFVAYYVKLKK